MAKRLSDTKKSANTKINRVIDDAVSDASDDYVDALNKRLRADQKNLFSVMAQQIIGAAGPPDEWGSGVDWQPLTLKYRRYRYKTKKVAHNRFFRFRSKIPEEGKTDLAELLSRARASTVFGAVSVKKEQKKSKGQIKQVIIIRPFPNVTEDLNRSDPKAKNYFRSTNKGIGFRLMNFQGGNLRPVLRPFMLWWMNVRTRNAIASEVPNGRSRR